MKTTTSFKQARPITTLCGLTLALLVSSCATINSESQQTGPTSAAPSAMATPRTSPSAIADGDDDADTPAIEPGASPSRSGRLPDFARPDEEFPDLWARIRAGFAMEKLDSPLIAQHEQWFVNNTEFMEAMIGRAKIYLYYIVEEVDKRGMPMEIALLPAIESAYKPYAYSSARASGLWQFIPSTGRMYGLRANWWYDGRRDVIASTKAALDYLQKLQRDFNGDWHLALAAYNAGEGRIGRAVQHNQSKGLPADFEDLRQLKAETKNYVPKLLAMARIVADPEKYGVVLADIPNEPYFIAVDTGSQIDLGVVAKLTNMSVDELHRMNPGHTRWATDPAGPHQLLVPVDKKDALVAGLSTLPEKDRVRWVHHEVRRGESLKSIARRNGLTVETIKSANNLRTNVVRVGQDLMLPPSKHTMVMVPTRSNRAKSNRAGTIIHRVRAGDTLWSIAKRYNVLVRQVAKWNLMKPNDVLRLGQRLKILGSGPRTKLTNEHQPTSVVPFSSAPA